MSDLLILGTDTDAGKTTFALLWLAIFGEYSYCKPIESGPSDTKAVKDLVPAAVARAIAARPEIWSGE